MTRFFILTLLLALACQFAKGQQLPGTRRDHAKPITVLVFIGTDCPISQKYMGELNQIAKANAQHISLRAIIPGSISKKELRQFVNEYHVSFPIVQDENFTWTKKWNATITPEVFLLNDKDSVLYQGAIDNWFFDLGQNRQTITDHYLTDAIAAALRGEVPANRKTEAVGCIIQIPKAKR